MKSVNHFIFLQLTFVFILTSGFTCHKKYPQAAPETETVQSEDSSPATSSDSSSENSNSISETTTPTATDTKNPADKTDK